MKESSKEIMNRLILSKYIYNLGIDQLTQNTSLSNFVAILNFHDATELFVQVIMDKVNALVKPKEKLYLLDYWKKISEATGGERELPMISHIKKLNDLRNLSKHKGIFPSHDSCVEASYYVRSFYDQCCDIFFKEEGLKYEDLSLAELIISSKAKDCVKKAEMHINSGDYKSCSIELALAFEYLIQDSIKSKSFFAKRQEINERNLFDPFHDHLPKFKDSDINRDLADIFKKISANLKELGRATNIFLLGLDPFKYTRFRLLTPHILMFGDTYEYQWLPENYDDPINQNLQNALFCLNFVIDVTLKIQSENFNILELRDPQDIVVIMSETEVYDYEEGKLYKVGKVNKGEVFKEAKLQSLAIGKFWKISFQNQNRYIKFEDATVERKNTS